MTLKIPYDSSILPRNVRSRFVDNSNGLEMHILEAGYETVGRPALLLFHGFPEIAFTVVSTSGNSGMKNSHRFLFLILYN